MEITLTFDKPFNKSLQVGDTIWYANLGDVKGYFAEVRLENDSTEKIELFAVSSEINESSK